MHSNQLGRSNPSRWGDLMWELSSEEFLSFKHWKDSNDIYHLLWAHCVADNVLSIYYLFTFLNPQKKTIWDYFPFWGKRPEVRASQLISDKAEIKSQGYPKLHRPCALKFHTSPQSLNSNACKGQSYWEWGLQTGNHSVASFLSFVNSLLIEIWVPIVFHHKKKKGSHEFLMLLQSRSSSGSREGSSHRSTCVHAKKRRHHAAPASCWRNMDPELSDLLLLQKKLKIPIFKWNFSKF